MDGEGNAYVTGSGSLLDFPSMKKVFGVDSDSGVSVTKLNSDGSALLYAVYIGGSGSDWGTDIAVEAERSVYLTGGTVSSDFPTTEGAFQPSCQTDDFQHCEDAFLLKLDPTGSTLVYSTYLGGKGLDIALGLAVGTAGNAYVTGSVASGSLTDFPTTEGAFQRTCRPDSDGAPCHDAFVSKINTTGSTLLYSTYLGASGREQGRSIAVDGAGNAYVTGETFSSFDFPTTEDAFQRTCYQPACAEAFVVKLNTTGSALLYSSYLGGKGGDVGNNIAVDAEGNAYVIGETGSEDFPTTNGAFREAVSYDGFIAKLNPSGSALAYSTYFDHISRIAIDASGNVYVAGSRPTPAVCAKGGFGQLPIYCQSAFVAKLNTAGTGLI